VGATHAFREGKSPVYQAGDDSESVNVGLFLLPGVGHPFSSAFVSSNDPGLQDPDWFCLYRVLMVFHDPGAFWQVESRLAFRIPTGTVASLTMLINFFRPQDGSVLSRETIAY